MRLTYSDLKNRFLDGTQNTGSTDSALLTYFNMALNNRYQLILAELSNWQTQVQRSAVTVAGQAFYHYPPGIVAVETATVTVNGIAYPLEVIESQFNYDRLNELLITTTAIPTFIFPRRDDFGIWPIPQDIYTLTLNYDMRDRDLSVDDYASGTLSVTSGNQLITGFNTAFTPAMIGQWLQVLTDGFWYRISDFLGPTQLNLENFWQASSGSGLSYRIGQTPELPEEAQPLLYRGAIADYYAEVRSDVEKATWFNNVFWTGDGNNNDRTGDNIRGGLIGIEKRYATRSDTKIVHRLPSNRLDNSRLWVEKIS